MATETEAAALVPSLLQPVPSEAGADRPWRSLAICSQPDARALIPAPVAARFGILPLAYFNRTGRDPSLLVAAPKELGPRELSELRFIAGCEILLDTAPQDVVNRAIHAAYLGARGVLSEKKQLTCNDPTLDASTISSCALAAEVEDSPVPQLLVALLDRALALTASDLHFEPTGTAYRVRFRIDGVLREESVGLIPVEVMQRVIRRVKILCQMDPTITQRPQEGGFSLERSPWSVRIRVATIPQHGGEKVVLRVLENSLVDITCTDALSSEAIFQRLGLDRFQRECLFTSLARENGAIVVSGPTGSGKSTLLYACLQYLNDGLRNIVTLEDPVERTLPGINQTGIKRECGLDYSTLLPVVLRADPDVVMIGEIREKTTAQVAFTAALTGHLVLTTIHAGNCLEVLTRLEQLEVDMRLVASVLRVVVAQRLVPKNCPHCLERAEVPSGVSALFELESDAKCFASPGCALCNMTGVAGRLGVFEFLRVSEELRDLMVERHAMPCSVSGKRLRQVAAAAGYIPFPFAVRNALKEGIVSPYYALRSLGVSPELAG